MREQENFENKLYELESRVEGLHIGKVKIDSSILAAALAQVNKQKEKAAIDQAVQLFMEIDREAASGLAKIADLCKVNKELDKRRKSIERIMSGKQEEEPNGSDV